MLELSLARIIISTSSPIYIIYKLNLIEPRGKQADIDDEGVEISRIWRCAERTPESPVTGITGVGFGGWVWSPVKPPAVLPAILSRRLVRLMVRTQASASAPGTLLNIVNRIRTAPWRGLDRPPAV